MCRTIKFTVPGNPTPQGRPRFVKATGRAFDPAKSRNYKALAALKAAEAMNGTPPLEGELTVHLEFFFIPPKSFPKLKLNAALTGAFPKTTKPDIDNLQKGVMDALKGICWIDDAQVTRIVSEKRYGQQACARVTIDQERPWNPDRWKELLDGQRLKSWVEIFRPRGEGVNE